MAISKEIKWDLTIIFKNNQEAREFISSMNKEIEKFQTKFKGKINRKFTANKILGKIVKEEEKQYSNCSFS